MRASEYLPEILEQLDDRPLPSAARLAIACGLCVNLPDLDDVEKAILSWSPQGEGDFSLVNEEIEELRRRVDQGSTDSRSARSALTWTMVPRDERLDGYILEFLIDMASDAGIEDDKIIGTVREVLKRYSTAS